jgi:hypothetical protein
MLGPYLPLDTGLRRYERGHATLVIPAKAGIQ